MFRNEQPDLQLVERLKVTLEQKLASYDVILGKTKYLAGDVSHSDLHACVQRS